MRILFYVPGESDGGWRAALAAALPQAEVRVWQPGDDAPADYACGWMPPAAMFEGRSGLKGLFSLGAGVDAMLDLFAVLPPDLPVIRIEDASMATLMAEYALHAVVRRFRRFDEFDASRAAGRWAPLSTRDRRDFAVGVMGIGVLGSRIADAFLHFGFPVRGWSRSARNLPGVECHAGPDGLPAFLDGLSALICVLPLTAETCGILCRATLSQLAPGAYLVNVARGAHLVEQDLLALLDEGHLSGAALDVFAQEPLPAGHPFWQEPRITITPHCAAHTPREAAASQIAGKIMAMEQGLPVSGLVDRTKGY